MHAGFQWSHWKRPCTLRFRLGGLQWSHYQPITTLYMRHSWWWKASDLSRETWRGKSICRILQNWTIAEYCDGLTGSMLDLGGGERPSYERYWNVHPTKLIRLEIDPKTNPDIVADLNEPLPFADATQDLVFLFNVVHIRREPEKVAAEVHRVLRARGTLWMISPFIFPESREPSDYMRYTSEGLQRLCQAAGFSQCNLVGLGERWSAAAFLISPFVRIRVFRVVLFAVCLLLDKMVPQWLRNTRPTPITYFCIAQKN